MRVTEVRIVPSTDDSQRRLKAFATILIDDALRIQDLKIIDGDKGLFVAMPSRKAAAPCGTCGHKNPIANRYCGYCGVKVSAVPQIDETGRQKLYVDVAYPIDQDARDIIEGAVIAAYRQATRPVVEMVAASA